jgi:hypothetical protein
VVLALLLLWVLLCRLSFEYLLQRQCGHESPVSENDSAELASRMRSFENGAAFNDFRYDKEALFRFRKFPRKLTMSMLLSLN